MADTGCVDLRSDTVTRPTAAMRRAMADAEVGDDLFGDDPTVIRLQEQAAALTGKQARLALLYNEQGLRPEEIAQKLGLSSYAVTQIILTARNRGKL